MQTICKFEDIIPLGKQLVSRERHISEDDFNALVRMSWANAKIHSNLEYSKGTQFGAPILPGYCTLMCLMGLSGSDKLGEILDQDRLKRVAMLELECVKFLAPVRPDDTIHAKSEILEIRPTRSNLRRAVLRVRDTGINQRGEVVLTVIRRTMVELVGG